MIAIAWGSPPTLIACPALFVAVLIGVTVTEPARGPAETAYVADAGPRAGVVAAPAGPAAMATPGATATATAASPGRTAFLTPFIPKPPRASSASPAPFVTLRNAGA